MSSDESPAGFAEIKTVQTKNTVSSELQDNPLRVVHTDGTVNYVDNKAVGGAVESMPKGYFRSPQFIGTVLVRDTNPTSRNT